MDYGIGAVIVGPLSSSASVSVGFSSVAEAVVVGGTQVVALGQISLVSMLDGAVLAKVLPSSPQPLSSWHPNYVTP